MAGPNGVDILAKLWQRTVRGLGLPLRRSPDLHAGNYNEFALRPDSSVVERGPEKAGVGGSIPSLATTITKSHLIGCASVLRAAQSLDRGPEKSCRRRFNPVSGHHYYQISPHRLRECIARSAEFGPRH